MTKVELDKASGQNGRLPFGSVVWRLTGANALIALLAVITSPLLARALGPVGRGELAAIFTILVLVPWISDLGLTAYLARERARDESLGLLLGSVIPVALAASLVGVAAAVPLAHLIGRGRENVVFFVEIGLLLLPLSVFLQTLNGVALGDQRWPVLIAVQILSAALPAVAIVSLAVTGHLTVVSVSITYLLTGFVAVAPLLTGLRGSRPWQFRWSVSRHGLAFGIKSWLATIAEQTNARLDQLLMAGLVSSRQLGLYALAVTLSTVSGSLIGAVANALFPRVAAGDAAITARACRVATLLVLVLNVVIGVSSPTLVPLVFGESFSAAVPMLVILLGASVVLVASQILITGLTAGGDPASAARAQTLGLAVTIPALLVLLPRFGGVGAAWVSVASYGVTLSVALRAAGRRFRLPPSAFLLPRSSDLAWLRGRLWHR